MLYIRFLELHIQQISLAIYKKFIELYTSVFMSFMQFLAAEYKKCHNSYKTFLGLHVKKLFNYI